MSQLPNAPAFPSTTYSGYLTVSATKRLHYVYAESINDPTNAPVTIWFNGGPGCSSMLGFMQENGPIVVDDGETEFKTNPYPWNQNMNMLWIESPAGVGWSQGDTAADLITNDLVTSQDALAALKSFYVKFPEVLPNQLFISGESYAGVYVPWLAWQVYMNNQDFAAGNPDAVQMNLEGFMVGNGATNWEYDVSPSFPQTVRWFNIITPQLLAQYEANNCAFYFYETYDPTPPTQTCVDLWDEINSFSANLNWYDLYRPTLPESILNKQISLKADRIGRTIIDGKERTYKKGYT
jgi:carboxypeptidase C (cathepsin A)